MNSCIYKIVNLNNNKFYIGSTKNIEKRIKDHLDRLRRNVHHNKHLQNSYNLYGKNAFIFHIIEWVPEYRVREIEQLYIDSLNPHYNVSKSASAPMDGRKHTKESREKMSKWKRPKGPDNYMYGKKWTAELREKILKKRIGSKRSNETKKKMSETSKKLNRYKDLIPAIEKSKEPIIDNKGNNFNSMIEAANFHKISVQTVCDILKRRHYKTDNGITFNYINKNNLPYEHKIINGEYKGVSRYHRNKKKWMVCFNYKKYHRFNNQQEAIDFYRKLWYNEYGIILCEPTNSN